MRIGFHLSKFGRTIFFWLWPMVVPHISKNDNNKINKLTYSRKINKTSNNPNEIKNLDLRKTNSNRNIRYIVHYII